MKDVTYVVIYVHDDLMISINGQTSVLIQLDNTGFTISAIMTTNSKYVTPVNMITRYPIRRRIFDLL